MNGLSGKPLRGEDLKGSCLTPQRARLAWIRFWLAKASGHPWGCCPGFRAARSLSVAAHSCYGQSRAQSLGRHLRSSTSGTNCISGVGLFFSGVALIFFFQASKEKHRIRPRLCPSCSGHIAGVEFLLVAAETGFQKGSIQRGQQGSQLLQGSDRGDGGQSAAMQPAGRESSGRVALPIPEQREFSKIGLF